MRASAICAMRSGMKDGRLILEFSLTISYRWGTIPIVEVAQQEKIIDFPPELDLPWDFIRQKYGITSLGGNVTSNFFCNLDRDRNKIEYAINGSMPEPIPSAEYYLIYAFTEPERKVCSR